MDGRNGLHQGKKSAPGGAPVVTRQRLRSPWDGHVLLLHAGEDERLARTTAWVRRGLDLGELVVHAGGPDGDALLHALRRRGVDVDAAVSAGRLEAAPTEQLADPTMRQTLVARALAAGSVGVRVEVPSGEQPALLARHAQPERDGQELSRAGRVSVLCRCARDRVPADLLRPAIASHPDGVRAGILSCRLSHGGLILSGEADVSVGDVLAAALGAVVGELDRPLGRGSPYGRVGPLPGGRSDGLVWVDVGDLRFLDVASARALVYGTRSFRERGGTVVLLDARPPVRHVLHLLGLETLDGLALLGGP